MTIRDLALRLAAQLGVRGRSPYRLLLLALGLLGGLGFVAVLTSVEISSSPQFCGSCHNMKPYYESWQKSKHRTVACVECHIAPGVTAEIRKKYEALSMVASYFTGTYGTNPWTQIDDAACLKCHERRLLAGKELFGDVLFDHTAHLSGMRRGKRLRCTSCHSQIVQGSHIAVTTSTCILCHFKGQTADSGSARCTLCHHIPNRVIERDGLKLNHGDVGRFGMQCTWCHARPAGSDGAVPRERCVTCHNEASRLEEYENTELLHHMHVSEHKVDCTNCHLEIQHVGPARIDTAAAACTNCHAQGHSPQANLFAGIGGRGLEPMPDVMFLAGVRCEGCHREIPGQASLTRLASDIACMSCHGPAYRKIYLAWREGVQQRAAAVQRGLSQTSVALGGLAAEALADARFNLELVVKGRGVHNVRYAHALLAKAHEQTNAARAAHGLGALPLPWREAPQDSACLRCHQGTEAQGGSIFGRRFRHEPHLGRAKLDCQSCHRPHEERKKGEVVRFDTAGCEGCHHRDARADCLGCHRAIREGTVPSPLGAFPHAFHLDDVGLECAACHDMTPGKPVRLKQDTCAACHESAAAPGPPPARPPA